MKIDRDAFDALVDSGHLVRREHPMLDLMIYNYTDKTQYERWWTPETLMARGLVVDHEGTVFARPFEKFFNLGEYYGTLPDEPFVVTEKIDGSLIICFCDQNDTMVVTTRGAFNSEQARRAYKLLIEKYRFYPDPNATYLFEIVYPDNRIVVDYGDKEELYFLAKIETSTGKDISSSFNNHPSFSFAEPFWHKDVTDINALKDLTEKNKEGFVIRYESGLRIKVKFEEYVRLHKLISGINEHRIWDILRSGGSVEDLYQKIPDELYRWINDLVLDFTDSYMNIHIDTSFTEENARSRFETRKEQAMYIKQRPYSAISFAKLDKKPYDHLIWEAIEP